MTRVAGWVGGTHTVHAVDTETRAEYLTYIAKVYEVPKTLISIRHDTYTSTK